MWKQRENTHLEVKLEIRRRILGMIAPRFRVLDCCAAAGEIWSRLRDEFEIAAYLPIDRKPAMAATVRMDSRRALRTMDLTSFNVIDIDTFGEPWEHWLILTKRLSGGRSRVFPLAVFLTHGHITRGGGVVSRLAMRTMGIPPKWQIPRSPKLTEVSASLCLTRGCEYVTIQSAKRWTSARVDYYGLLVTGAKHGSKKRKN